MYMAEINSKLDTIASVFAEYINASNDIELLWSEKLGYVYICLEHYNDGEVALSASQIEVPEDLMRNIFLENALDIMAELFGVESNSTMRQTNKSKLFVSGCQHTPLASRNTRICLRKYLSTSRAFVLCRVKASRAKKHHRRQTETNGRGGVFL